MAAIIGSAAIVENDPAGLAVTGSVKQALAGIGPAVPIFSDSSFAAHMELVLYEERRNARLGLGIALLALALGAVGVHGVVSLVTARRRRELVIRVALGASRRQLLRLLLGRGGPAHETRPSDTDLGGGSPFPRAASRLNETMVAPTLVTKSAVGAVPHTARMWYESPISACASTSSGSSSTARVRLFRFAW